MTAPPAASELVASARRLTPLLRERADVAERERDLPDDVVAALSAAGLFRMCVPAVYGGPEPDPLTILSTIEAVSEADGAAGWCTTIATTTSSQSLYLRPDVAAALFGPLDCISGGSFAARGNAVRADGGWVVDGHWSWGSGTSHCTLITAGATCDDGTFRLMFMPSSDVTVLDNWDAVGLRGTGSHDFTAKGAFVPEDHAIEVFVARPQVDAPLGRFPNFGLLASGVAACLLGIARHAVEELVDLAEGKTPFMSSRTLATMAAAQIELSHAEAAVSSARAFLHDEVGRAWDLILAGTVVPVEQRARIRLACANVGTEAARAVDICYTTGGGSSVHVSSPLQRCLRDIHTATQHILVSPRMWETFGRLRFGQKVDPSML
jgi:alkylation response protein AidB-like acyl-CoA dehydrogenase